MPGERFRAGSRQIARTCGCAWSFATRPKQASFNSARDVVPERAGLPLQQSSDDDVTLRRWRRIARKQRSDEDPLVHALTTRLRRWVTRAELRLSLDARATVALALLLSLLSAGLAHASRLCATSGHASAAQAKAVHAHCGARPAQHPTGPAAPGEPAHGRDPACCARGLSLAAIPPARGQLAASATGAAPVPAAVAADGAAPRAEADLLARAMLAIAAPDPGSGRRRHLVQRVLLL